MNLKKRIRNIFFDISAPLYDRIIGDKSPMELPQYREGFTLDLGGGTGRITGKLKNVVVLDLSRQMLRQSRKKGLLVVRGEAEKIPFKSGVFEQVVVVDAFHHFLNQKDALQEVLRILEPGGLVYIKEPDIDSFAVKVVSVLEKLALMGSHFRREKELIEMAESIGFVVSLREREPYYINMVLKKPQL